MMKQAFHRGSTDQSFLLPDHGRQTFGKNFLYILQFGSGIFIIANED